MTRNHSGPARLRAARGAPWRAPVRALGGLLGLLLLFGGTGASADGGRQRLGWSTAPRWRLPSVRRPDCPEGQALARGGSLVQVRKARCVETGPKGQVPAPSPAPIGPSTRPRPAPEHRPSAPLPGVRDEVRPAPRPPSPRPELGGRGSRPGSLPTIAAGPDATELMRMDTARCHEYLRAREVPFVALGRGQAPEVAIPVRLRGAIAGVSFTIPWSKDEARDAHAIWDCRLVAALVPVAEFLHAHGVTEVQYFSALRRGKIVRDKPRSQHNVGLALDLLGLRGPTFALATVENTYPKGQLRSCPAGGAAGSPGGPVPVGAAVDDLYLALVCQSFTRGLFHTILTPDHDRAHANHLHLDLKAAQRSPADPFMSVHD
jgi:hypothetical protein